MSNDYEFSEKRNAYRVQLLARVEKPGVRPEMWDIEEAYPYTKTYKTYRAAEAYAKRLSASHPEAVQVELVDMGCTCEDSARRVYLKGTREIWMEA